MRTIGERLEEALRLWERPPKGKRDKKAFQEAIKPRLEMRGGQMGITYQTILSYFDGSSTPSLEWLREAADLLTVCFDWLVLGRGEAKEMNEIIRVAHEQGARESEAHPLDRAVLEGLTATVPLQEHLEWEYRTLSAVAIKLGAALMERSDNSEQLKGLSAEETYREAGRLVGEAVSGLLETLHAVIPPDEGPMAQVYVTAAAHAVDIIVPFAYTREDA